MGLIEQGWNRATEQESFPANVDSTQLNYVLRVKGDWMNNGGSGFTPYSTNGDQFRATTDKEGINEVPVFAAVASHGTYGGSFYGYVNVPSLSDTFNTSIYLWGGNFTASKPAVGSTNGQYNTFIDHLCFLPFNESTSPFNDLSSNGVTWSPNVGGTEPFVGTTGAFNQYTYYDTTRRLQASAQIVTDTCHIGFFMRTSQSSTATGDWYNGNALIDADMPGINNADWGISVMNGGAIAFGTGSTTGADITITTDTVDPVNVGGWFRVDVNWNSSTGAVEIFINGVLRGSGTANTGNRNSTNPIIGNNHDATKVYVGDISELEFTDDEIVVSYAKIKYEVWANQGANQRYNRTVYSGPLNYGSSVIDGTISAADLNEFSTPGETRYPVAAIVTVNGAPTNPGTLVGTRECISFCTGDFMVFCNNSHGNGTVTVQNICGEGSMVYLTNEFNSVHTGCSFLTMTPGGINIWCWNFTSAIAVNIQLFYDAPAFLDIYDSDVDTGYENIPFRPNYIETLNFRNIFNAGSGNWFLSRGFAEKNNQGSLSVFKQGGTIVLNTMIRNDAITQNFTTSGVPESTIEVTGWNEDTIDLTITGTLSTKVFIPALIFRLPEGHVQVGTFENQSSTGNFTIPVGFKPVNIDILTSPVTAYNTTTLSTAEAGTMSMGSHNVDDSSTISMAMVVNLLVVDSISRMDSDIETVDSDGVVIAKANIVEFTNLGAVLNWTVSDATNSKGVFVAFKAGGLSSLNSNLKGNLKVKLLGGFQT